jgi:hypothetical protein
VGKTPQRSSSLLYSAKSEELRDSTFWGTEGWHMWPIMGWPNADLIAATEVWDLIFFFFAWRV